MRITHITPIALLVFTPTALTQIEIQWDTINSGSGLLSAGGIEAHDTIGQHDAGELRTNFVSMNGGFWAYGSVFCPADLTTQGAGVGDPGFGVPDGLVTASDINYFVNAWVSNDLSVADLTTQGAAVGDASYGVSDGLVTGADINYYVNLWVAGCP